MTGPVSDVHLIPALVVLALLLLAACVWLRRRGGPQGAMADDAAPMAALPALTVGLLAGGVTWLGAGALAVATRDASLGPPWSLLAGPASIAATCVTALILGFDGRATLRPWLVLGATLAAAVPWVLAPVSLRLGIPQAEPLVLGLVAATLCGVVLSSGRRARRVAIARVAAVRAAGDGILVVDGRGRTLYTNEAADRTVALTGGFRSPESRPSVPAAILGLLAEPQSRRVRLKSASGRFFEAWVTGRHGSGPMRGIRALLFRDITSQYQGERRLVRLAHYDSLTGLANRRLFLENLERAIEAATASGELAALLYFDLDHFKELNDSLGHAAGDTLLQTLAERFRNYFESQDLTSLGISDSARIGLARLGGDEFAIVIPRVKDSSAAGELAQQLLQLIGKPMTIADRSLTHSASVGIALFPDDAENVESLIHHADAALYAAKSRGRNRHAFYESSFDARAERRHAIEQGLREALARGEFRLHYQPKVDTATEEVVGFEALLRWKSQELGDVGPGEFIPIAEERRMIGTIGAWCLEEACRQIKSWSLEGFEPVPVSVNVSSAQFEETDLQRVVTEALRKHTVDPQLLELELTESLLLAEGEHSALPLRDLRAIGVRIALDDFGTGYSALTYLNRFPLDVLKMDRGLLSDIEGNAAAAGIAAAVVSMAHSLGLTVVAEGIDSAGQLPVLREMSCDQIQGFLYAPGVPAEEAERFLARRGEQPPCVIPGASQPGRLVSALQAGQAEPQATPSAETGAPVDANLPSIRQDESPTPDADLPDMRSEPEAALPEPPPPCAPVGEESRRLLLLDDGEGSLGALALRLARLGVDLHYAVGPDEGLLFVSQEKAALRLLVAPPSIDTRASRKVRDAMAREIGSLPPFVVIGEEPNAATRARLRDAGVTWVLWAPFDDTEVRFVVRSAMALPGELSQRRESRVPVDVVTKVHAGARREVAVLSSLSARGAFIEMTDPLPIDSQLRLEFDLGSERFRLFARVVHCQQDDPDRPLSPTGGMGVVFFGPDREVELALRKGVEERASRYLP